MQWFESVLVSLASLRANKLRSILTLVGVIIGVSTVIAVVSVISGMNRYVASTINQLGAKKCVGAVYDGRYVYFVPYADTHVIARYDTKGEFRRNESWQVYEAGETGGLETIGYDGGVFDGRYV